MCFELQIISQCFPTTIVGTLIIVKICNSVDAFHSVGLSCGLYLVHCTCYHGQKFLTACPTKQHAIWLLCDAIDFEGKTDSKIRVLEVVEELKAQRADKQVPFCRVTE